MCTKLAHNFARALASQGSRWIGANRLQRRERRQRLRCAAQARRRGACGAAWEDLANLPLAQGFLRATSEFVSSEGVLKRNTAIFFSRPTRYCIAHLRGRFWGLSQPSVAAALPLPPLRALSSALRRRSSASPPPSAKKPCGAIGLGLGLGLG